MLREYVIQVRTDLISQVLQPGQFSSPERNLTFHIRDRTYDGELLGILMQDARDKKQVMSYLAERGALVKQADSTFLVMTNGHIVRASYTGIVPDTFKNDSEVVLTGTLGPDGFHATGMTAKCPSKYEASTTASGAGL